MIFGPFDSMDFFRIFDLIFVSVHAFHLCSQIIYVLKIFIFYFKVFLYFQIILIY